MSNNVTLIEGREATKIYRLLTLRYMLKLEVLGLKRRTSPSAYSILKDELRLSGNRKEVLEKATRVINKMKEDFRDGRNKREKI